MRVVEMLGCPIPTVLARGPSLQDLSVAMLVLVRRRSVLYCINLVGKTDDNGVGLYHRVS